MRVETEVPATRDERGVRRPEINSAIRVYRPETDKAPAMPSVISVVQQKGGVGKTTVSVCLAGELAQRGIELTLVDADKTGSARSWADPGKLEFPVVYRPVAEDEVRAWAASINKMKDRLLVIDCAPNGYSVGAATALADLAILPCGPSGLDLEGAMQALRVIDTVRTRRDKPLPVIIVPTRVDSRTLEGRLVIEELEQFGEKVAGSLGYRTDFVRAYTEGLSVNTFAPGSVAHDEIRALADAVLLSLPERQRAAAAR
jgi:chromosome partitioning protein